MIDLSLINIEDYLKSKGIRTWDEGKNVKDGWINIQCPFCDDKSNHLGISPTGGINCWRCPAKGTIVKLVMSIERKGVKQALEALQKFKAYSSMPKNFESFLDTRLAGTTAHTQNIDSIFLTEQIKSTIFPAHATYLRKRNFDPDKIYSKYKLYTGGSLGKYKNRIIIPFYSRGNKITFTSRDITDKSGIPYLHQPVGEGPTNPKEEIYNIDSCGDTIIVVEGPIDVFRIGNGCGATCGIKFTHRQVLLLSQFKRVFIMYDAEPEAQEQATRLASNLSSMVPHVEIITLGKGDPGEMTSEEVTRLRSEIFGR